MTAEEFYKKYIKRMDIQLKYHNKNKEALLYEVMEEYATYKSK